jgi:ribosome-associated protein
MDDESQLVINDQLAIPLRELEFRFSQSSGPGGQHVNKSSTQVTLLFDVAQSPSLDETTRARLLEKLASRLTKEGVLQISVQESRSQHQNREAAVARFQAVLSAALRRPKARRKTKPSRGVVEKRLETKRRRGLRKRERNLGQTDF